MSADGNSNKTQAGRIMKIKLRSSAISNRSGSDAASASFNNLNKIGDIKAKSRNIKVPPDNVPPINVFDESELSDLVSDEYTNNSLSDDELARSNSDSKKRKASNEKNIKTTGSKNKHIINDSSSNIEGSAVEFESEGEHNKQSSDNFFTDSGSTSLSASPKPSTKKVNKNNSNSFRKSSTIYKATTAKASKNTPSSDPEVDSVLEKGSKKDAARSKKDPPKTNQQKAKTSEFESSEELSEEPGLESVLSDYGSSDNSSVDEFGYQLKAVKNKRMTKRQLARFTNNTDDTLLELQTKSKKQEFTEEEIALRRSEYIRKRKFQSMQRAEQLKNETINRLLSKQTIKGRNKLDDEDTKANDTEKILVSQADGIRWTCSVETAPKTISEIDRTVTKRDSKNRVGVENIRPSKLLELDKKSQDSSSQNAEKVHMRYSLSIPKGVDISDLFPSLLQSQTTPTFKYQLKPKNIKCNVEECNSNYKYKFTIKGDEENSEFSSDDRTLLYACGLEHYRKLTEANTSK